jgi:hypothetical protein
MELEPASLKKSEGAFFSVVLLSFGQDLGPDALSRQAYEQSFLFFRL